MISALESIDWHQFLGRPPLPSPQVTTLNSLSRGSILISGAGGSIGSALALRLAAAGALLVLLESSENNLFELESSLTDTGRAVEFYLGSIADVALLNEIFARHRPQLVFHAAAFKHVPLLEGQPFAAIENNVMGTQTLVTVAKPHGARVILLSTDKAVTPASVMGATKRVAEQIVFAAGGTVLRLGNVLGSRGSVSEVFARQIENGHPLTVTDPAARRYFLTIEEAVDLLLAAAAEPDAPALFVPQLLSPHYIADLARFLSSALARDRIVPIEFTRLRAGDKESEALFSPLETPHAARANGLVAVDSRGLPTGQLLDLVEVLKSASHTRHLSAALSILRRLVPDYTPSRVVENLQIGTEPPVRNV